MQLVKAQIFSKEDGRKEFALTYNLPDDFRESDVRLTLAYFMALKNMTKEGTFELFLNCRMFPNRDDYESILLKTFDKFFTFTYETDGAFGKLTSKDPITVKDLLC